MCSIKNLPGRERFGRFLLTIVDSVTFSNGYQTSTNRCSNHYWCSRFSQWWISVLCDELGLCVCVFRDKNMGVCACFRERNMIGEMNKRCMFWVLVDWLCKLHCFGTALEVFSIYKNATAPFNLNGFDLTVGRAS